MIVDLRRRWLARAKCAGMGTDVFFSDHSPAMLTAPSPKLRAEWNVAKKICADCPVRVECARDCLGEQEGVWGGLDPAERYKYRHNHGAFVRALSGPRKVEYAKLAYDLHNDEHPWYEIARIMGLSQTITKYLLRWYEDYLETGDTGARDDLTEPPKPGTRVITDDEISRIRNLRQNNLPYSEIARRVGFSEYTVRRYCLEETHAPKDTRGELLQAG